MIALALLAAVVAIVLGIIGRGTTNWILAATTEDTPPALYGMIHVINPCVMLVGLAVIVMVFRNWRTSIQFVPFVLYLLTGIKTSKVAEYNP